MQALSLFCRGVCRFPRFAGQAIDRHQIPFLAFPPFLCVFALSFFAFLVCYCFLNALGYQFTSPEGERIL